MTDISQMRVKLKKYLEGPDIPDDKRIAVNEAIAGLEMADEVMWDWMHAYTRPDYEGDLDIAQEYLESEKKRISNVSETMLSNMATADSLIHALKIK